jgi:hypothetical protein
MVKKNKNNSELKSIWLGKFKKLPNFLPQPVQKNEPLPFINLTMRIGRPYFLVILLPFILDPGIVCFRVVMHVGN